MMEAKKQEWQKFSPNTQNGELVAIFEAGGKITHYEAAQLGIMSFHARISELIRAGYPVTHHTEKTLNKFGKRVERGVYYKHTATAAQQGEAQQQGGANG